MRITLFVTILSTAYLLQACGSQTTKTGAEPPESVQQLSDQSLTGKDTNNQASANTFQLKPAKEQQHTAPETQIIRELHHAGCLIEDFELDRRKQNMRISCAKDTVNGNSSI